MIDQLEKLRAGPLDDWTLPSSAPSDFRGNGQVHWLGAQLGPVRSRGRNGG